MDIGSALQVIVFRSGKAKPIGKICKNKKGCLRAKTASLYG
jgi:hypothetical protein